MVTGHVRKSRTVTKHSRCPVCHGDHTCSVTDDGLILCGRLSGPQSGFIDHGLAKGDPQWNCYRRDEGRTAQRKQKLNWFGKACVFKSHMTPAQRERLAKSLELPVECLSALPLLGYDEKKEAFTFPEVDADEVIGINCRYSDGRKKAMHGSRRGLTLPKGWRERSNPLMILEGPSDVLATEAAGKRGIGRPSNTGGVELLVKLLADFPPDEQIIVAGENDCKPDGQWPGRDGAQQLSAALARRLGRPVPYAFPPDGYKDAREYISARAKANGGNWKSAGDEFVAHLVTTAVHADTSSVRKSEPVEFANFKEQDGPDDKTVRVGISAPLIQEQLLKITGGWPKRVGQALFVEEDGKPLYLDTPAALFAWISRRIPANGEANPIRWGRGDSMVGREEFFAYLQQTVEAFNAVELFPHWPLIPGHYYLHPPLQGGDDKALRRLLSYYKPATQLDADLILSMHLTPAAGLRPGCRPAFLLAPATEDMNAGRGVGKIALAEAVGQLYGGYVAVAPNDDIGDVKRRVLSPEARGKRLLLIDNVKSLRYSSDELEAFITSDTISGHQMYVGEGRVPNTFTVLITVNGATLSKDLAQRCVMPHLERPTYSATWREDVTGYIEENRWAILGDLIAILKDPGTALERYCRWGAWENLVLSRLPEPSEAQQLIRERQDAVDDDMEEAAIVREAFADELKKRLHDPGHDRVFIPTHTVAEIIATATGEKRPTNKASAFLKTLGIGELRKSAKDGARGWTWSGLSANGAAAVPLNPKSWHPAE
jgi:hypothetical protein